MSESVLLPQVASTQEALALLRNMREKRRRENPASIYDLVKNIYSHLKQNAGKVPTLETIKAGDYLGSHKESIQEMLVFIKEKVVNKQSDSLSHSSSAILNNQLDLSSSRISQNSLNEVTEPKITMQQISEISYSESALKQKQMEIVQLQQKLRNTENLAKQMQIKLLNNVKRLTIQVQEKDVEVNQLRRILTEKQLQLEEANQANQSKYMKIRKLQEDMYDLQMELVSKKEELESQRQCADFLQKKVGNYITESSKKSLNKNQISTQTQAFSFSSCSDSNDLTATELEDTQTQQSLTTSKKPKKNKTKSGYFNK